MTVEDLVHRANNAENDDERTGFLERACAIAAKLAPYVHPRLSAIEHKLDSQPEPRLLDCMTDEELIARLQATVDEKKRRRGHVQDSVCS